MPGEGNSFAIELIEVHGGGGDCIGQHQINSLSCPSLRAAGAGTCVSANTHFNDAGNMRTALTYYIHNILFGAP